LCTEIVVSYFLVNLHTANLLNAVWIGHIWWGNQILEHVFEGKREREVVELISS